MRAIWHKLFCRPIYNKNRSVAWNRRKFCYYCNAWVLD